MSLFLFISLNKLIEIFPILDNLLFNNLQLLLFIFTFINFLEEKKLKNKYNKSL